MLKLITCSIVQCVFLALTQVFLILGVRRMEPFSFTWKFFRSALVNWQFALSGVSVAIAALIWFYIIRHFDKQVLSIAYPMISLSYVFGMIASVYVFHEHVPLFRWIGVCFIIIGVAFLTYKP